MGGVSISSGDDIGDAFKFISKSLAVEKEQKAVDSTRTA